MEALDRIIIGRREGHPVCKNRLVVVCLEQGVDNDLHINSMTDTLFFQIISFKKYFYVSLGNFFTVFVESP